MAISASWPLRQVLYPSSKVKRTNTPATTWQSKNTYSSIFNIPNAKEAKEIKFLRSKEAVRTWGQSWNEIYRKELKSRIC
jgi:hypothetical protein